MSAGLSSSCLTLISSSLMRYATVADRHHLSSGVTRRLLGVSRKRQVSAIKAKLNDPRHFPNWCGSCFLCLHQGGPPSRVPRQWTQIGRLLQLR